MTVKNVTQYVVLAVYLVILITLLRPGGTGSDAVAATGSALADLVA